MTASLRWRDEHELFEVQVAEVECDPGDLLPSFGSVERNGGSRSRDVDDIERWQGAALRRHSASVVGQRPTATPAACIGGGQQASDIEARPIAPRLL